MSSKSAFTIIELIFVIVIIGILGTIAMSKMATTRDDAKIVQAVANIKIATADIISYRFSQHTLADNILDMSDALKYLVNSNQAAVINSNKLSIKIGSAPNCLTYELDRTTSDATIKVLLGPTNGDTRCTTMQDKINISGYPVKILGKLINSN